MITGIKIVRGLAVQTMEHSGHNHDAIAAATPSGIPHGGVGVYAEGHATRNSSHMQVFPKLDGEVVFA